jgi:hypothetical protein
MLRLDRCGYAPERNLKDAGQTSAYGKRFRLTFHQSSREEKASILEETTEWRVLD